MPVQRELARLEAAGIVTSQRVGKQKHFQANAASPVFEELHGLALKTFALGDLLREALGAFAGIQVAFIYGSISKGTERAASDVDLMIISDNLGYGDLLAGLEETRQKIRREIAPTIYSRSEFATRLKRRNAFVTRVMAQPKLWLIGDDQSLR